MDRTSDFSCSLTEVSIEVRLRDMRAVDRMSRDEVYCRTVNRVVSSLVGK